MIKRDAGISSLPFPTVFLFSFFLFVVLAFVSASNEQINLSVVVANANVSIQLFSMTPTSLNPSGSADFFLSLSNNGSMATNATPFIYVYAPSGARIALLSFSQQVIYVTNSTSFIYSGWSAGSLAEGSYSAVANATYYLCGGVSNRRDELVES
ncbi:hypothetical protein HY991_04820 [Candidatus Micrarchaeota archaeon]|nr:hypothetical protein [Candidatus Micrarchaeota archaeon]